jgi:hypothetical protein
MAQIGSRSGEHRWYMTATMQATQIGDGKHLGANEWELDGIPTVTMQRDSGLVQEWLHLASNLEVTTSDPNIRSIKFEIFAVELKPSTDQKQKQLGRIFIEKYCLTLWDPYRVSINWRF